LVRSAFDEEMKLIQKWRKNPQLSRPFLEFRRIWKAKGPIKFAYEVLEIDPNTGGKLMLSEDQKEFLLDVSKRGVRLVIITAGRGAGKTFVLAVYIMWRIFTHENWGISCMGGSAEQSDKLYQYISGWLNNNPDLAKFCMKINSSIIKTYENGYCSFHACSGTSVRGPHTHELIIDEQAAGEEKGGTKFIKAAIFQVSTSPDIHIIKSSTAHWIHGDFLQTLNNAKKLGYKVYRWAIAKHISGETDPYKIYRSNDEWLVEALGGVSRTSGLVFNPVDLDICICDRCVSEGRECRPYEEGYCPLVQFTLELLLGMRESEIPSSTRLALQQFVKERVEGVDWGKVSPCAYTAVGRFRDFVFVLKSLEIAGAPDEEKIETAVNVAEEWNCDIIRPDPREWSFNNILAEKGFAIHQLFTGEGGREEKNKFLFTLKKYVERHHIVIPVAFEDLIRSLRNLAYDNSGKVRKQDDHSFDSLLYAVSYYGEITDQSTFWEAVGAGKKVEKEPVELRDESMVDDLRKIPKKKGKKKKKDPEDIWTGIDLWGTGND